MSILKKLSSQTGDRTEYSNRKAVLECLDDPELIAEIVEGLASADAALVGDCAEVLTKVAEHKPEWAAPYAETAAALLSHKATRVRWEAMHLLALTVKQAREVLDAHLSQVAERLRNDASVIVRDYAADALADYAALGKEEAERVYHYLTEALTLWNGKQAGHALIGLANVAAKVPALHGDLRAVAEAFGRSDRAVVRKAAKALLKAVNSANEG